MPSESQAVLTHRGAVIAAFAASCWILFGLESIVRPVQDNLRDAVWMLPFALTAAAFWYVHRVQASPGMPWERAAFHMLMTASALVFCGNAGLVTGHPALAVLAFPWGALLWTAGMLLFGAATWQAAVFPRAVALTIMLLEPGSLLTGLALSPIAPLHERGAYSAGVEKGAALAVVAFGFLAVRKLQPSFLPDRRPQYRRGGPLA